MPESPITDTTPSIVYRPGTADDSYAVFNVFEHSLADLYQRTGRSTPSSVADPEAMDRMWEQRRSLFEHLARTADQFWLAEREGRIIGFARSIVRDVVRELTEFFVLPGAQSAGVGRELLSKAFPPGEERHRSIIATAEVPAQALYLKTGVYPRFPLYYFFSRQPEAVDVKSDLEFSPIEATPENLEVLAEVDKIVLGHQRNEDHQWLLEERQGYIYCWEGRPVGYGYLGKANGPFALLEESDFPAVLAHAESEAAAAGRRHFGVEVPMINRTAVDYLLSRGFRMDSFIAFLMSDEPFGKFENYIVTSPPFIL